MTRPFVLGAALAVALTIASPVRAHEGHLHKIMGTVSTHHDRVLEVKAVDGKTSLITLNDATTILRGKAKVKAEDIKPGERIVVAAKPTKNKDGHTTLIATEIRLASPNATATK
jgi:hypothetical protein